MRLTTLLLLLIPTSLLAADLKLVGEAEEHHFVKVASDKSGQWLVLGPNAAVILDTTTIAGTPVLGKPRINRASSFTTDDGKGVIFVGAPGFYAVTQWGITDEPEPSVLVVEVVKGGVIIPPIPTPPTPVPPTPTPVPPDPTPAGSRSVYIIRETADTTAQLARLITSLRAGPSADYLRSKSHNLIVLDDDAVGSDGKPSQVVETWRPHFKDLQLPVLIIVDPKTKTIVHKSSLPANATDATVLATLKAHGG